MYLLPAGLVAPTQRTIPDFQLHRPRTIAEAVAAGSTEGAVYAQGCTDLFARFREGLACTSLVSLERIPELGRIEYDGATLAIGAAVDHHLEPFVTVADVRGDQIEIWSSTQNPFPLRKELARVLRVDESRIRVHVPYVGGGFGAKHNCKTEPIAILLSRLAERPVRYCLTTEEGFRTLSQHAAVLKVKTGVMADGTFVARESTVLLDSGAYSDGSPLVAEKAAYRMPGPYRWTHIKSSCACVLTTTTPAGPFRGFGATQSTWASESQVDMIAHRLGMDPYELRIKNLKKLGEPFVPGESGIDSDLAEGLDAVAGELGWAGAEVDVDPETGKVTVLQLVASGDVGKAINTLVCRGQDEGAAVMGLGQALFEEMRYDGGVLLNGEALDYRVPMAEDLPERFVSITQEQGHGPGPFGAKGAGEGAMVPVAAAIANAVHDATGARIT